VRTNIVVVDAFTAEPYRGNPAAVCVLDEPGDDEWMQLVAREMRHSETAFLHPEDDAWRLRWFTPTVEVELCGHATLASAHVLFEEGRVPPPDSVRFLTLSGELTARRLDGAIVIDLPAEPAEAAPWPDDLAAMVGAEPRWFGQNRFDVIVEVSDAATVARLEPDLARVRTLEGRGLIVTGAGVRGEADYVCRGFFPNLGIDEDPVTGAAQCALGPFWAARTGRDVMVAHQLSERGGVLRVAHRRDRVEVGGAAVTVLRGELLA